MNESRLAQFVRGLVKFVFIGCYIAFMWASIHKVAYFFGNFEADGGNGIGSFALAGAFDITALVTTIGVMFFRRSMPRYIQIIVWAFITAIVAYTFLINWEYDAHFQSMTLIIQPTGDTTPIYDQSGMLHYVPIMRQNTLLLFLNPLLASGFTIFALIYSIVAEFFGVKQPTIQELKARKTYLEETATVLANIKELEGKQKGKGIIQTATEKALEIKSAVKEITKKENGERNTDELEAIILPEEETIEEESEVKSEGKFELSPEAIIVANRYENAMKWLSTSGSTVSLKAISSTMNLSMKLLHNRVARRQIRATKNKEIVYKDSLIAWLISEIIPKETSSYSPGIQLDKLKQTLSSLEENPDLTDEQLAGILNLRRPASARFWRIKSQELMAQKCEID